MLKVVSIKYILIPSTYKRENKGKPKNYGKKISISPIFFLYEKGKGIENIKPPGQPFKLSVNDERFIVRSTAINPKINAPEIARTVTRRIRQNISSH